MSVDDYLAPEIYRQFVGFEALTEFFGYWPGFHDAEILSLSLTLEHGGPTASLRLHAFDWTQEPDTGRTMPAHHCVAELRFIGVENLHLADFDARNVISELRLAPDGLGQSPPRWLVAFPAARGLDGHFSCGGVEVAAVVPGLPPDSVYAP